VTGSPSFYRKSKWLRKYACLIWLPGLNLGGRAGLQRNEGGKKETSFLSWTRRIESTCGHEDGTWVFSRVGSTPNTPVCKVTQDDVQN